MNLSLSSEKLEKLRELHAEHQANPAVFMEKLRSNKPMRETIGDDTAARCLIVHARNVDAQKEAIDRVAKAEALFNAVFDAKNKGRDEHEAVEAASAAVERVEASRSCEGANPFEAYKAPESFEAYAERIRAMKASGEIEHVRAVTSYTPVASAGDYSAYKAR